VTVDRHRARAQDLVRFDDVPDRSLQAMASSSASTAMAANILLMGM